MDLALKAPLPADRSLAQVRQHYLVEKAIADRLRAASREERQALYAVMYTELFAQVPDHPRLRRRESAVLTRSANISKLRVVARFLHPEAVFVEFGPGDCRFAVEAARRVRRVIGVDISDQSGSLDQRPDNLQLVVYDGYNLDLPAACADVVFSDQLIEHFHPEDTRLHFELAHRLLRPGGRYVFRTPHAFTGPHDVSRYFCDEPQGFHLKEWTYRELGDLLREVGYADRYGLWRLRGRYFRLPFAYYATVERVLAGRPKAQKRLLARYLIRELCMVAER